MCSFIDSHRSAVLSLTTIRASDVRRNTWQPFPYSTPEWLHIHALPATITTAAVDRFMHHAHVVVTDGDSYRFAQARDGKGVTPLA